VRYVVDVGNDVDKADNTPLLAACGSGDEAVVRLLDRQADVENNGMTTCVQRQDADMEDVDDSDNPNPPTLLRIVCLQHEEMEGHVVGVRLLLRRGALSFE